ncbi:MAG: tryptophan synthase subunit alpha [Acidobacteriota bacterium]
MSRIKVAIESARGRGAFVPYAVAGDPDQTRSLAVLAALAGHADVLEVGVPWSDPIADGPENQMAMQRALAHGATLARTLDLVAELRRSRSTPVVLMTYLNPILRMGIDRFVAAARDAHVAGLLVTDLPLEEWGAIERPARDAGLDMIALCSPTTPDARAAVLARRTSGFLYVVARLGVTGGGMGSDGELGDRIARLRSPDVNPGRVPLAVGFGISSAADVARVLEFADAAVVGSAFSAAIREALEAGGDPAAGADARASELRGA